MKGRAANDTQRNHMWSNERTKKITTIASLLHRHSASLQPCTVETGREAVQTQELGEELNPAELRSYFLHCCC